MSITGIITKVIFTADKFCVFAIGETKVSTKVFIYLCREGNYVTVTGLVKTHEKYGDTLVAENIQLENIPLDLIYTNIAKNCSGIGKKTVDLLQSTYGNDFLNILETDPESVKKLLKNKNRFESLQKYIIEYKNEVNKCIYLSSLELDPVFIKSICNMHLSDIEFILKNNPYLFLINYPNLMDYINAYVTKISKTDEFSEYRIQAEIYTELLNFIKKTGGYYLDTNLDFIKNFNGEHKINEIELCGNKYTLSKFLIYEKNICNCLKKFTKTYEIVGNLITENDIKLTSQQTMAVELAITNPVFILTGGPGTGKSTTVKFIIDNLLKIFNLNDILICALTGTAVNNIENIINNKNITAMTMHRFIMSSEERSRKVVIIDELSLVDISTFSNFLLKCNNTEKLILIGDPNQIPSISPGQLLKDLLMVKNIPNLNLTIIQRQCAENTIIKNAYKIINGEDDLDFDNEYCIQINEIKMQSIADYYIKGNTHVIALTHIIVNKINTYLQEKLNPNTLIETKYGNFKIGDKVKQTVNNYDLEVYNGQIGYITHIENNVITVDFGNYVEYKDKNILELNLAYATTIHSTQGCEFDTVIIIIKNCDYLLNRNVFYTAITRAKKRAIIIGDNKTISLAISKKISTRNTNLTGMLQENNMQNF